MRVLLRRLGRYRLLYIFYVHVRDAINTEIFLEADIRLQRHINRLCVHTNILLLPKQGPGLFRHTGG